jgi:hypothetical protein
LAIADWVWIIDQLAIGNWQSAMLRPDATAFRY